LTRRGVGYPVAQRTNRAGQAEEEAMSLARLIPAWMHGIGDYGSALALIVVALVVGGSDEAVLTGVIVGAALLLVSIFTRYPLGVVKEIPFPVHSAGDYLAAIALIVAPLGFGYLDSESGLGVFYIVVGAAIFMLSLVTDYQDPRVRAESTPLPAGQPSRSTRRAA
jgi:hypothetical protein